MSCSSNLDGFRDGWQESIQQLLWGMLPPRFVQYSSQYSSFLKIRFVSFHTAVLTDHCLEKQRFILSDKYDFHMTDSLLTAVHTLLYTVCDLKAIQMKLQYCPIQELMHYVSVLDHNAADHNRKYFSLERWRYTWSQYSNQISEGEVGLKQWIPRLCFEPLQRIQWVELGKYQANSTSHIPVWFVSKSIWICRNCTSCYQNIVKLLTPLCIIDFIFGPMTLHFQNGVTQSNLYWGSKLMYVTPLQINIHKNVNC